MSNPIYTRAEDISDELEARLRSITLANACETDIGINVMVGRRRIPADDEVPCVQMIEGNDETEDTAGRLKSALIKASVVFAFDAFDKCDPNNPNRQAHKMIRDMKRAIFKEGDRTLGGRVIEVRYLYKDIGSRPDGKAIVQARVAVEIAYAEDLSKP